MNQNQKKKKEEEETNTTKQNITFERIVEAEIIDDIEYEKLLTKQNKRLATDDDKYKIKKYAMSKSLGVDNINIDILKAYTNKTNTIHNYMSLIDRTNIKKTSDLSYDENIKRTNIIDSLIFHMGFKNIFDDNKIERSKFEESLKKIAEKHDIYTKPSDTKSLFNLSKLSNNELGIVIASKRPYNRSISFTLVKSLDDKAYFGMYIYSLYEFL